MAKQTSPDHAAWQPPSTSCAQASLVDSYSYLSAIPSSVLVNPGVECILGVDEAGRGPVLGPMVYGVSYCSVEYADTIKSHGFMDSKVLDHDTRVDLLQQISDPEHVLFREIGWSVRVMSAQDIGAGMLRPVAPYNLNAQAHDTTIQLIRDVLNQGVNVRRIYVDTVGIAETYQAKLQREFPMTEVTVCKKADSIYPIVSVASICAKVTRDKALQLSVPPADESLQKYEREDSSEANHESAISQREIESIKTQGTASDLDVAAKRTTRKRKNKFDSDVSEDENSQSLDVTDPNHQKEHSFADDRALTDSWGSGYPSDPRTQSWLRNNMNAIFGWLGPVRYSWSTVKDMLEPPNAAAAAKTRGASGQAVIKVDWFESGEDFEEGQQTLSFSGPASRKKEGFTVSSFIGSNVGPNGFRV